MVIFNDSGPIFSLARLWLRLEIIGFWGVFCLKALLEFRYLWHPELILFELIILVDSPLNLFEKVLILIEIDHFGDIEIVIHLS
jgi:hypothetical protein